MATLQSLQEDISKYFIAAEHRLYTADRDLESRFGTSPIIYMESPLDKPLPPLPTPVDCKAPFLQVPSPTTLGRAKIQALSCTTTNDTWHRQRINAATEENWVDSLFAENDIAFGAVQNGYAWKLGRRIYENADFDSKQPYAAALYECSQIKGRVRGPKAYMKVYMQIPCYCHSCEQVCSKPAEQPDWITSEIAALKRMSQVGGEVFAPRLLATKTKVQGRKMWVPGGFLTFIVMQRLPGTILNARTFWSLPAATRADIKASFRDTLQTLWQAGIMPQNCGVEKLAWDRTTRKCYIIDLQGAEMVGHPLRWWDYEYFRWGLSKTNLESPQTPLPLYYSTNTAELIDNKIKSAIGKASMRNTLDQLSHQSLRPHTIRYELASPDG